MAYKSELKSIFNGGAFPESSRHRRQCLDLTLDLFHLFDYRSANNTVDHCVALSSEGRSWVLMTWCISISTARTRCFRRTTQAIRSELKRIADVIDPLSQGGFKAADVFDDAVSELAYVEA